MALPDYQKSGAGTAVIWGQPSGTGVTLNMSLNNLANNAARMGAVCDLGALWDEEQLVYLVVETGTTPVAAATVELYMAATDDISRYAGTVDGTDAAYTVANRFELGPPVSVLYAIAGTNTVERQNPVIWRPPGRYVVPVFVNFLAQAIRNVGTASNNASRVIMVPRKLSIED